MKKIFTSIAALALVAGTRIAFAQEVMGVPNIGVPKSTNVADLVGRIASFAFGLLIAISVLFIMYAAYLYLTSGGSEEKVKEAKQFIIYAIIAILVGFLSFTLVTVVQSILFGTGGNNSTGPLPTLDPALQHPDLPPAFPYPGGF